MTSTAKDSQKQDSGQVKQTLTDTQAALIKEDFWTARSLAGWVGAALSGFACLFLALSAVHIMSPGLQEQDIADRDLKAPSTVSVQDRGETDKVREKARQSIVPIFQVDKSRDQLSINNIARTLARAESLQAMGIVPLTPVPLTAGASSEVAKKTDKAITTKKILASTNKISAAEQNRLLQLPDGEFAEALLKPAIKPFEAQLKSQRTIIAKARQAELFGPSELTIALAVTPQEMSSFKATALVSAKRLMSKFHRYPVMDKSVWHDVVLEFLPDNWTPQAQSAATDIIASNLEANLVIDPESTRQKADEVTSAVLPVLKVIKEGEIIVPQGSIITRDKLSILQELGITHVNRWPFIFSMAISLGAALILVGLYLYTYETKHFFSPSSIGLMFTVQVVVASVASLVGKTNPQFVPIPAAALILTIFFGRRAALALTIPMILLLAVDRLMDLHSLGAHTLASLGAIWAYSSVSRSAVFSTGILVAVGLVVGDLAATALDHTFLGWGSFGKRLLLDFAGGITSSIVAVGSLPFLENLFGLITPFRLAELTDANQPLLRRLEENAPGTYQHSLAVANMAEAGAKAIYADANLVRAGALYHDIGKMVRPKYFIENQLGATNPHDSMSPEDSRARVLAHVSDGIALAQKYSLPKAIQDFIPMHQGTTLMAYFYHKACTRDGADNVDPSTYRYPGPKPNSKETAIVMLADVAEAVTHSMRDPSQEEVDEALTKVFQNRWDDGQFNESTLSYEEMQKVKSGFARVWRTLHHERLKYPSTTTGKMAIAPAHEKALEAEKNDRQLIADKAAESALQADCCANEEENPKP
ncbi:MAG: HDIG domain-containing protein [Candidatus Obscuribacter sp.]|nr:HDIG domain-containing protein [Candidatus Obscuribacter sp.]